MSSDAATNVVDARISKNGTQSVGAGETKITGMTVVKDSNGMWDGTNNRWNILVAGDYRLTMNQNYSALSGAQILGYRVNGAASSDWLSDSAVTDRKNGSALITNLKAGDYIEMYNYSGTSATITTGTGNSYYTLERISGPAQIAASETVAARYKLGVGNNVSNNTVTFIDFETKDFDTHGFVSGTGSGNVTTTNTGWKGIVPIAGKYTINANLVSATGGGWAAGEEWTIGIYIDGVQQAQGVNVAQATHSTNMRGSILATLNLKAGQRIEIFLYQSSGGTLAIQNNASANNYVEIIKVGN